MTLINIRLLGSFEARVGEGPSAVFPTKKARALLAYLALRPGTAHSRDEIAGVLWGDREDEQARGSLRRTLSDLRKALPLPDGEWLVSSGDTIMLSAGSVQVDTADFERLSGAEDTIALERSAALYSGELLAGFGLDERGFEDWLRAERERLRALALKVHDKLLASYDASHALDDAVRTAIRLLALDPINEPAHRALMSLYARQGRRGEALRQYQTCREALARELGILPDDATEALHRDLQQSTDSASKAVKYASDEAGGGRAPSSEKPSIAILPFKNMSGDPEQEYFVDGLTEDIITALSRSSELWVIARTSTFTYKGAPADPRRVARELGVRFVMEGSVRRSGQRLRITAQLTDAVTGREVWAERYDRTLADLFDIQDEITRSVAASTETQVLLAEGRRKPAYGSSEANDLLARARSRLYDQTPEAVAEVSELTEEALRIEPANPTGHMMRASVVLNQLWFGEILHDEANTARAMELARTALRLAPHDERAHLVMAWAWAYAATGRLQEAIAECERGLEINPNSSLILGNLGAYLAAIGKPREAIEACRRALQLNPRDPSNFWRHYAMAAAHFAAADYVAALDQAKKTALSRPHLQSAIIWAASAAALGESGEARVAIENCLAQRPDLTVQSVVPHYMLRYARNSDHERLLTMLRKAGLPG